MQTNHFPRRRPTLLAAATVTATFLPLPASAQLTRYYVGNGAPWNTPSSWSTSPAGPPGASVPANGDTASLSTTTSLNIPFDATYTSPGLASVSLDATTPGTTLTLSQTSPASTLYAATESIGNAGSAAVVQSNGTNAVTGNLTLATATGSAGAYTLSNSADLNVGQDEIVGESGSATFTQSDGTHSVTSLLYVSHLPSASGTFNLSAGLLRVGDDTTTPNDAHGFVLVGSQGTGTFVHSGGTLTMARTLRVGGGPGASGTYTLSGDALLYAGYTQFPGNELIGYYGAGSFTQTGGTNTLTGTLTLARYAGSSGNYTLSAGSLAAARTTINSNGTFSYTGGTASLGALTLTGTGSLLLSPGHDKTLSATSLSLASTSTLDLADNTLSLSATSLDTVRSSLTNHSLFSSTADADPRRALAYAGTSPLLVQLTVQGDANLDGVLNADDYALLDRSTAKHVYDAHWADGDFNYDGAVDQDDYLLIDSAYLQQQGGNPSPAFLSTRESQFGAAYVSELLASVPEPSSLSCLVAGFVFRPRRKSPR